MLPSNRRIAELLEELAILTVLDEGEPDSFRVRAYRTAIRAIEGLTEDVADLSATQLAAIKGIGKSIAGRIREHVETGRIERLEELRARHPDGQRDLLRVPGLGPKTIRRLADEHGITDVDGLVEALQDGRLEDGAAGMGERTLHNLAEALRRLGLTSKQRRIPITRALPLATELVEHLRSVDGVDDAVYAGSLRRFREDIGDIDLLVAAEGKVAARAHAALLAHDLVESVIDAGEARTSVLTRDGVQVDLRTVPPATFGAALVHATGSQAHNVRLRQRALRRGWTLSEHGLVSSDGGDLVAGDTEEDVYGALDLPWITPELREDAGEIDAAEAGALPSPVRVEDLRGDLHDHTDLSGDGRETLEALVAAVVDRGLDYLAITDHAQNLAINGVSFERLVEQRAVVRELEQQRGDVRLLHGAELNIGSDGDLDYDDAQLATFDWLVASVHSHFGRDVRAQTARVLAAMRNPSVTAIGHLTGRRLGERPGIELDLEAVLDVAAETGTAIEINASLARLDAPADVVREGARRGVVFVVSTDTHSLADLDRARHGAAQARRAGLEAASIANTWELAAFEAWLASIRS